MEAFLVLIFLPQQSRTFNPPYEQSSVEAEKQI